MLNGYETWSLTLSITKEDSEWNMCTQERVRLLSAESFTGETSYRSSNIIRVIKSRRDRTLSAFKIF